MMRLLKYAWLIGLSFGALNCNKVGCSSGPLAPESIASMSLKGKIKEANGILAASKGQEFSLFFNEGNSFYTQNKMGTIATTGTYQYTRNSDDTASLVVTSESGTDEGMMLQVNLTFSRKGKGDYQAVVIKGEKGAEKGTFVLSKQNNE